MQSYHYILSIGRSGGHCAKPKIGLGVWQLLLYYNTFCFLGSMLMLRSLLFVVFSSLSSWVWSQGLVVSTHPIYLIAQAVTQGVEQPQLLLVDQTGHDVHLTPAHRKAIQEASLVLWLGKAHEAPLEKLLSQNSKAVALLDMGILTTLPQRNLRGAPLANTVDSHVWYGWPFLLPPCVHNNIQPIKCSIWAMPKTLPYRCVKPHSNMTAAITPSRIGRITMLTNI